MDDSKLIFDTKVQYIKYRVLSEVAKSAYEGDLLESLNEIPKIISPGPDSQMRCCIYKERAIVNERINRAVSGVKKGQNVTVIYKNKGLQITSKMEALSDGGRGDLIKFINTKSAKEVVAKIVDKNG